MVRAGQAAEKYAMGLVKEMEQRFRDGTLNYHYRPEHRLYEGGPKAKFRNNVEAIRLLKQLQQENRMASTEEQIILARFVGWGGLANALTPGREGWEKEYDEITELLTEEEMQSAAASTLTSYYTDQKVIGYIYQALYQFGFRSGNILDPAMGTGNFFSALPESMSGSKLYGVELEPVAGGIARKLYPQADILIKGYEDTEFSDSFFDVVVGNVPFHSIRVSDRRYDRYNFKIHDYFLAKSLDKVRSGGIVAVITSRFTLDKENQSVRKYIAQRAELIGAIRLPENAFKQVAGTEVTADILFLKKRVQEIIPDEHNTPWLFVERDENGVPYNSYFIDHPEMVLGTMAMETGMSIVVSTFTGTNVDPIEMAEWSYENGYYCPGGGSYHSLIPKAAEHWGLFVDMSLEGEDVADALAEGKLVVALMSKGHFTKSGHFIVLRGITPEGKVLVADPASLKRSNQEWDLSLILKEAKRG